MNPHQKHNAANTANRSPGISDPKPQPLHSISAKEISPQPLDPDSQLRFLKRVGPKRAESFAQLGVNRIGDLLEYFPRDYEFLPPLTLLKDLTQGQSATVVGEVTQLRYVARSRPPRMDLLLTDANGQCRLKWFHGGFLRDKFLPGDKIAAWGKVSTYQESLQLVNPGWMKIECVEELFERQQFAQAVYPAGSDLSTRQIAQVIAESLDPLLDLVEERFDTPFLEKSKLIERRRALRSIHQPTDQNQLAQARRRLAYDELFLMQLGIAMRRQRLRTTQPTHSVLANDTLDKRIRRLFPFLLTEDQNKVIAQICTDMAQTEPMNRLLQGDVGSGKTVVALYAALLAIANHYQVAIMTPTEVLAEQHFQSIERYLRNSRVRRVLLTGGLTGKKRKQLLEEIQSGQMDLIVGTQALLQKDITFDRLALVIVDEQHKFGVRQRQLIRGKDVAPHYLVMTATPIPRTMSMTIFGDLDISTIEHLPPGRKKVVTRWIEPEKLPDAYKFIRKTVNQGQQVFFVYPRVEEELTEMDQNAEHTIPEPAATEGGQIKAAIDEHKKLQKDIFPEFNVGLIHGQMDSQDKRQIMDDFRKGKIKILVATVVIEVGLDVPNATVMVIEHADRFGLAQLHQLRGRIGRGKLSSYCLLFGQPNTPQAQLRLEIMTKTSDGFRIAEEDLRIRGPGELLGTAQHGLNNLKIADIINDIDLLRMARRDAFALAEKDPFLKQKKHQPLRNALIQQFGDTLDLVDVG